VVMAVGFPYSGRIWKTAWPRAMTNLIEVCAETGARLIFADNLYMYGPQSSPLREDMPLSDYGVKPAVRAGVTRIWMQAAEA
ncbi:epimerase, partial [Staphylococcus aureus]